MDHRGVGVRFPAGERDIYLLYNFQTDYGTYSACYKIDTGDVSLGCRGRGVKLTTHLHLVPEVKNNESILTLLPTSLCIVKG
jgi:hypothetical protein